MPPRCCSTCYSAISLLLGSCSCALPPFPNSATNLLLRNFPTTTYSATTLLQLCYNSAISLLHTTPLLRCYFSAISLLHTTPLLRCYIQLRYFAATVHTTLLLLCYFAATYNSAISLLLYIQLCYFSATSLLFRCYIQLCYFSAAFAVFHPRVSSFQLAACRLARGW